MSHLGTHLVRDKSLVVNSDETMPWPSRVPPEQVIIGSVQINVVSVEAQRGMSGVTCARIERGKTDCSRYLYKSSVPNTLAILTS